MSAPREAQRVMIVDDNAQQLRLLDAQMREEGYEVLTATSGSEALLTAATTLPDLFVVDVLMPEMDGIELIRRLKADPRTRTIPIITLTVLRDRGPRLAALGAGAEDFLSQPTDRLELATRVKNLLRLKAHQDLLADSNRLLDEKVAARTRELAQREQELRQLNEELEARVRQRTAELESANADLESFSYSVSHDLRAPLRAIDGFSHLLESEHAAQLDAEGRRLLSVVRQGATRMGHLIDDVLAFSRLGRQAIERSPVDMSTLVEDAMKELAPAREGRQVELRIEALPPACGDAAMLRQIWINLLANALKFTRPRAVAHIEVGGRQDAAETVYWVKDDGVGFDMQYADKLFGVFQRLHGSSQFEGTGAGLAIVKRIVMRHGGRVWAQGSMDAGATFGFALPLAAHPSATVVAADAPVPT